MMMRKSSNTETNTTATNHRNHIMNGNTSNTNNGGGGMSRMIHPNQNLCQQLDSRLHVMTPREVEDRRRKAGLCPTCGIVQTHRIGVFGSKPASIEGLVYKGICLQCNNLHDVIAAADANNNNNNNNISNTNDANALNNANANAKSNNTNKGLMAGFKKSIKLSRRQTKDSTSSSLNASIAAAAAAATFNNNGSSLASDSHHSSEDNNTFEGMMMTAEVTPIYDNDTQNMGSLTEETDTTTNTTTINEGTTATTTKTTTRQGRSKNSKKSGNDSEDDNCSSSSASSASSSSDSSSRRRRRKKKSKKHKHKSHRKKDRGGNSSTKESTSKRRERRHRRKSNNDDNHDNRNNHNDEEVRRLEEIRRLQEYMESLAGQQRDIVPKKIVVGGGGNRRELLNRDDDVSEITLDCYLTEYGKLPHQSSSGAGSGSGAAGVGMAAGMGRCGGNLTSSMTDRMGDIMEEEEYNPYNQGAEGVPYLSARRKDSSFHSHDFSGSRNEPVSAKSKSSSFHSDPGTSGKSRFETLYERKIAEANAATARKYVPKPPPQTQTHRRETDKESGSTTTSGSESRGGGSLEEARKNAPVTFLAKKFADSNSGKSSDSDSHGTSLEKSFVSLSREMGPTLYERKMAEDRAATARKYVPNDNINGTVKETKNRDIDSHDSSFGKTHGGKSEDQSMQKSELSSAFEPRHESSFPSLKKERSRFGALADHITERKISKEGNESMNSADKSQSNTEFNRSFASSSTTPSQNSQRSGAPPPVLVPPTKSNFETLYERKISEANAAASRKYSPTRVNNADGGNQAAKKALQSTGPTTGIIHKHQTNEPSIRKSPHHIKFSGDASSFCEMLDFLKLHISDSPSTVAPILARLRECLAMEFEASGNSIMSEGRWKSRFSKIIVAAMSNHPQSENVQLEALRTVWVILAFSSRCISEFISHPDSVDMILKAMKRHNQSVQIQECGLGLISCIATIQKHGFRLAKMPGCSVILQLVDSFTFPCRSGAVQMQALTSLYRISSAFISSSALEAFLEKMQSCCVQRFRDKKRLPSIVLDVVIEQMTRYHDNPVLNILGCKLLWNIFVPAPWNASEEALNALSNSVGNLVNHLQTIIHRHKGSLPLHESVICLLSKISCYDGSMLTEIQEFAQLVVKIMTRHGNSWIITLHGCRCLRNICARELTASLAKSVIDSCKGVEVIVTCMEQFSHNHQVLREACGSLAAVVSDYVPNKRSVLNCGGIAQILKAYDSYLISPYDDFSLNTKIQACAALSTLATEPSCMDALVAGGVISTMKDMLNEDENVPEPLAQAIQTLLDIASDAHEGNGAINDDSNEADFLEWMVSEFQRLATTKTSNNLKTSQLRSTAILAMNKFPNHSAIQEVGCNIFAYIHCNETQQSQDSSNQELEELVAISMCMKRNQNSPSILTNACLALKNYCISRSSISTYTINTLKSLFEEVLGVLEANQERSSTLCIEASGSLWAMGNHGVNPSSSTERAIKTLMKLAHVCSNEARRPMQELYLGTIWSLLRTHDADLDNITEDLLDVVVRFMTEFDEAESFEMALNVVIAISKKGYKSILAIADDTSLLDLVIGKMFQHSESPSLQGAICVIISNISGNTAMDNGIRAEICSLGGVNQILFFLETFSSDRSFVSKALTSLSAVISGADVQLLRGNGAVHCILNVMNLQASDLYVQIKGTAALWYLAARDDEFKCEIVKNGGAQIIVNSMQRFTSSEKMQENGLIALWSLSTPWQLRSEMGHIAVAPIIQCMQAHITGRKMIEDGLSAIKALSTHAGSKKILQESDAIDLIIDCMKIHYESAGIQQIGLGALSNLSVDVDANAVSQIDTADLDTIVTAMQMHQTDRSLQESALILLKNYSFSPVNYSLLRQHSALPAIIKSAAVRFSDTFSGRTDFLLGILS